MPYDKVNRPPKVPFKEYGPGRTRQSEAKACDINNIISRYKKTGVLPPASRQGLFMDVSQVGDYREAVTRVNMAQTAFMQLPAKVRSKFDNDPALFLDFCSDPGNREEMVELGLIEDVSGEAPKEREENVRAEEPPEPIE